MWSLIENEEFVYQYYFNEKSYSPKILSSCGNLFSLEKVSSSSLPFDQHFGNISLLVDFHPTIRPLFGWNRINWWSWSIELVSTCSNICGNCGILFRYIILSRNEWTFISLSINYSFLWFWSILWSQSPLLFPFISFDLQWIFSLDVTIWSNEIFEIFRKFFEWN